MAYKKLELDSHLFDMVFRLRLTTMTQRDHYNRCLLCRRLGRDGLCHECQEAPNDGELLLVCGCGNVYCTKPDCLAAAKQHVLEHGGYELDAKRLIGELTNGEERAWRRLHGLPVEAASYPPEVDGELRLVLRLGCAVMRPDGD